MFVLMQYLGIIEQRTSEILQAYAATQIGRTTNDQAMLLPAVVTADSTAKLHVQPPSYEDMSSGEDSDDDEDERPLTRQELDKRTLREFSRKGAGTAGSAKESTIGNRSLRYICSKSIYCIRLILIFLFVAFLFLW